MYDPTAFGTDLSNIRGRIPVLGICYGAQYMVYSSGGKVEAAGSREYGRAQLTSVDTADPLLKGIQPGSQIWMSHGDSITSLPAEFKRIAGTNDLDLAAYRVEGEKTWGVQFHPEVYHTLDGILLLENFLNICGSQRTWSPASFIKTVDGSDQRRWWQTVNFISRSSKAKK